MSFWKSRKQYYFRYFFSASVIIRFSSILHEKSHNFRTRQGRLQPPSCPSPSSYVRLSHVLIGSTLSMQDVLLKKQSLLCIWRINEEAGRPSMPAVYPLYSETIKAAIVALNKRNGFSSQAIEEYIKVRNYKVGEVGPHLKNLLPLESLYTPRLVRKAPSRCPSRKRRRNIRRNLLQRKSQPPETKETLLWPPITRRQRRNLP